MSVGSDAYPGDCGRNLGLPAGCNAGRRVRRGGGAMLHELLLALVGCTGDVFMDVKEQAVALGLSTPQKTRPGAVDDIDGETDSDASESIADECTFRVAPDITFLKDSER